MSSSFRYASSGPFNGETEDGEEEDEEAEEERCRIPRGKDRLTWLIENLAYHFEATKRVYGFVKDACTPKSCPSMTAGPQYEYLWMDEVGYSRPTRLAACKYISRLFHHWCDLILLDHTFGPPQGCEELLGTVFRRLFRVYGHVYYSHLRKIVARRKEAELNRYFKRLVLFAWHHKLIPPSEMEPLQSLINTLLCIKPYCYLATGTGLVAAHAYRRATFTLQAVERNHSAIGSGGDRLTCHLQDLNGTILPTHIKDSRDGTYTVTYLPTEPGRFSFHFSSLTKTKVVAEGFRVQVFPSLASDLIKVLTEEQFVDVTFKAGDTRNAIKAHKMIINARLKGFEILNIIDEIQLSSSVRETTFREFINYIYTGYVDTRNMKNYMIAELLLMAKNYGLEVLEKALERMENGGHEEEGKNKDEDDNDDSEDDDDDDEQEEEEELDDEEGDDDYDEEDSEYGVKKKEKGIEGLGYGSEGEGMEGIQTGYDGDEGYNDYSVHDDKENESDSDSDYPVNRKAKKKKEKKRKGQQYHQHQRSTSKTTKASTTVAKKKKARSVINDFSYRDHGADFEKCINSWKFSDFIFSVYLSTEKDGGRNVPVRNIYTHKLFLVARSGFFRDLFNVYRDLRKTNIIIREDRAVVGPGVPTTEEADRSRSSGSGNGSTNSNELVMSEEKKNFIYVPSYFVFLVFLKWVYTDAVDLDLADSDHMAKLLDNPHAPRAEPEEEERTMSDLLFLARKFKAVGLIAILIQHKNQKEKKRREMQRASELAAARGGQQPPPHLSKKLSGGGAALDRAHSRKGGGDPTKSSQAHHRLKKKSGSKLKSGSGSRTEKLKKFIASSPSNLSSGGVPTRYPYGEMTSSSTTQGTAAAASGSSAKVTYPYGEMAASPAPALSASLSPGHQPLRLAYDSDDDDSAIGLKKANAAAARKSGKSGERGGQSSSGTASSSARPRAETNSGEYRTGIMRLVASSNSPAPASPPLSQESPYVGLAPHTRPTSTSLLAPPPIAFHPPAASSSLLRPPPTSFATSPYAPPPGSAAVSSSDIRATADARPGQPPAATTTPLFSLPAYTPAPFSIPATTIQQGSAKAKVKAGPSSPRRPSSPSPSSSTSPPCSHPQPHAVQASQPPASPYAPPSSGGAYSPLLSSMPHAQQRLSPPLLGRAFSIPTLVIEDASSPSPASSSSSATNNAGPPSPPPLISPPQLPSASRVSAAQTRARANGHDRLAIPRPSQHQGRPAQPVAPPPSSAGYSDLEEAPPPMIFTSSSPFPPPAHFNPHRHQQQQPPSATAVYALGAKRPTPLASEPPVGSHSVLLRSSPASAPSSGPPQSPRLVMSSSPRDTAASKPKRSLSPAPSSYAPSATSVPSSATTAGLGSSPRFTSSLKSSHSRNHSAPGMSSLDSGAGSGAVQHQDEDQVSFLKNGRVTLLTSLERKKTTAKAKTKGGLKSKKDKKASKDKAATADASIMADAKIKKTKAKTKTKTKARADVGSSNSSYSSGSTSKEGKATPKAEKKGKQLQQPTGKHQLSRSGARVNGEEADDDDAEEEAEVEIEASDESEDDFDGVLHQRKASCIVKEEDVRPGQESHLLKNNLKHNWRDSL